jgi:hypothetical protein
VGGGESGEELLWGRGMESGCCCSIILNAIVFFNFKGTVFRDVTGGRKYGQYIRTDELYNRYASFLKFKGTPSPESN